jgi:hypothetical protein
MMKLLSDLPAAKGSGRPAPAQAKRWWTTLILGLGLLLIYSANNRELGTDDTLATSLLPLSLARGDGFSLDRFAKLLRVGDEVVPFVVLSRGRIISRYPVAPALLVLPLMVPQIVSLDSREPSWEHNTIQAMTACRRMGKWSSTALMVLAAVILYRFLLRLGLSRGALPAVLAAFLGSDLWPIASQALWQHGPAALALIAALTLFHPWPVSRWRLVLAGIATTLLFTTRLMDSLFAAVI